MTTSEDVWTDRDWLLALCFRMLGSTAEAEDAVQETFVRWLRLTEGERHEVRVPGAWLRRTATRICLDVLGSARVRREQYAGDWLPDPLPRDRRHEAADPADQAVLDESVSMAVLVVMESMTPAERVAFVLHDVFGVALTEVADVLDRSPGAARQLASSARRRVSEARSSVPADRADHRRVVQAFQKAATSGDLAGLVALLAPDVTVRSDGGGLARAARNRLHGADRVARFLLGILAKNPDVGVQVQETSDGQAVLVLHRGSEVTGVLSLAVGGGQATLGWFQVNPEKIGCWAVAPSAPGQAVR